MVEIRYNQSNAASFVSSQVTFSVPDDYFVFVLLLLPQISFDLIANATHIVCFMSVEEDVFHATATNKSCVI